MLLRCEIERIAERVRDHWDSDFDAKIFAILSDLILTLKINSQIFFFKKNSNQLVEYEKTTKKISTNF